MAEERHCKQCGGKLEADAPQGLCPQCLIKLGLPTGADIEKTATPDGVPTNRTPPGMFIPPEPKELATQFDQLEILELLGQGGMGAVYKARQKQLDRFVALKILPPEVGETEAFAERFTREARSMAKLSHQHVVTLHEFGHTKEGLYYFIMEFVDGTDLRHVIQTGELSPDEALVIVPQVCEALHYAHKKGIVHRDIKPENILLDKDGNIKIADFGLAKLLDRPSTAHTLTAAGHKMGTPHYMAPEQIEGAHEVDHRADIYSLGVVFYEMLTGQLPIGHFAPPSQKVQVDVRLDKVVLKSLAHEPERRYQHASEVKTDIETVRDQEHVEVSSAKKSAPETLFGRTIGEHLGFVAVLRIVWGTLGLLLGAAIVAIMVGPAIFENDPKAIKILSAFALLPAGFIWLTSILDVIAGIGLLKRRNWARILGIIGGILDLLAIPVGTAIGIYTIWILTKKEIINLSRGHVSEKERSVSDREIRPRDNEQLRRFSRTAIVGACWALLAILLLIPIIVYYSLIFSEGDESRDIMLTHLVMAPFVLLGLTPLFGTTILGIVSITHIRHSAGRLYGIGLALFDALFFPLILLNIILFCIFAGNIVQIPLGSYYGKYVIFAVILACPVLDFLIIRWAWRKANAGLEPVQIPTGETPQPGAASQASPSEKLQQPERQVNEIKRDIETIAAESKPAAVIAEQSPTARKFSRAAIVGACLSALALFWMPAALIYVGEIHKSDVQELIMWVCILIGSTPVFCTTILGMVSIGHIRQSAGRVYGMGLALFDSLLFPLLALDVALSWLVFVVSAEASGKRMGLAQGFTKAEVFGPALLICIVADILIVRWSWRRANAGLEPAQSYSPKEMSNPGSTATEQETEQIVQNTNEPDS
ncbi:MAG: serine/threonine-protein kinase [Planctomycetota bacterium]|jgi:tRNA A-37 threonylcarbamoyl transferase component Bud32